MCPSSSPRTISSRPSNEKDQVEQLGLLKMDLLGLRNLTVIHDALEMIEKNRGIKLDINHIPDKDEATCRMLCEGIPSVCSSLNPPASLPFS